MIIFDVCVCLRGECLPVKSVCLSRTLDARLGDGPIKQGILIAWTTLFAFVTCLLRSSLKVIYCPILRFVMLNEEKNCGLMPGSETFFKISSPEAGIELIYRVTLKRPII